MISPEQNEPVDVNAPSVTTLDDDKNELLDAAKKIVQKREHSIPKKSPPPFNWKNPGGSLLGILLFFAILLYAVSGMIHHRNQRHKKILTDESVLPASVQYGEKTLPGKTFVGLEATRTEKDPQLIEAVQQVINSKGTPGDVFQNDVPPEQNVAVMLRRQFDIYRQNPGELNDLRQASPYQDGQVDRTLLDKVSDTLERLDPKRLAIRQMLNNPDACFSFEFVTLPPDKERPDLGPIPDTEASDFLADYALLEQYAMAQALLNDHLQDAIKSTAYIFRIAQLAAQVKNPGIRTKAGEIRMGIIDSLQAVVLHPKLQESDLAYLYAMLQEQLDAWSPDADAWIGDRASGMKVYNLILQYGLDEALEPQEINEMILRGIYDSFKQNLRKNLIRDQIFYLQSMQKIIDSCNEPFYRRLPVLNQIDDQIRSAQGTREETIIAEFLLRGTRDLMQYCSQDRTKCELATLAMAASLQHTTLSFRSTDTRSPIHPKKTLETLTLTPLYGKNYDIQHVKNDEEPKIDLVRVSYVGNFKPFQVPDFSRKNSSQHP